MASMTRNELATAIAGERHVDERPSHSRIEDANGKQICYVQGKLLICKTDTLTTKPVLALVRNQGYNRSVFRLDEKPATLKAAARIVENAEKGHAKKLAAPKAAKAAPVAAPVEEPVQVDAVEETPAA